MALAYSARFSRCGPTRPGSGLAAAAASSELSSHETNVPSDRRRQDASPQRRHHAAAQFAHAFSQTGASDDTCARSIVSNISPAVFSRWLWHVKRIAEEGARIRFIRRLRGA